MGRISISQLRYEINELLTKSNELKKWYEG